jgi:hypothetical protein
MRVDPILSSVNTNHETLCHRLAGIGGNIIGDTKMFDVNRLLFLRIALVVIGLTFIFGIYTLGILWPSGWVWGQGYSHYLMMIMGVYATLGVFLLIASRNPYAHKSLIWFTVWSSFGSWGDHGRSGCQRYGGAWSSGGRCACAHSRCDHTCSVDAADRHTCSVGAADRSSLSVSKHW